MLIFCPPGPVPLRNASVMSPSMITGRGGRGFSRTREVVLKRRRGDVWRIRHGIGTDMRWRSDCILYVTWCPCSELYCYKTAKCQWNFWVDAQTKRSSCPQMMSTPIPSVCSIISEAQSNLRDQPWSPANSRVRRQSVHQLLGASGIRLPSSSPNSGT